MKDVRVGFRTESVAGRNSAECRQSARIPVQYFNRAQVARPVSLWHMANITPDLQLSLRPQSIAAFSLAPNYTVRLQRHVYVCERLVRDSETAMNRTGDLSVASQTPTSLHYNARHIKLAAHRWRLCTVYCMLSVQSEYCEAETFRASCPNSTVIVIRRALYGRMRLGRCVLRDYGYVGCFADVVAHMDAICSGRRACSIRIPDAMLDRANPCPKDFKTYLLISYDCVPGAFILREPSQSIDTLQYSIM